MVQHREYSQYYIITINGTYHLLIKIDSLCYTLETYVTLYINYTSIKRNKKYNFDSSWHIAHLLSEYSGVLHPWKNTVCEHMLVCAIVFCKTDISIIRSETEQFFKYINCHFCFNLPANYLFTPISSCSFAYSFFKLFWRISSSARLRERVRSLWHLMLIFSSWYPRRKVPCPRWWQSEFPRIRTAY